MKSRENLSYIVLADLRMKKKQYMLERQQLTPAGRTLTAEVREEARMD